MPNWCSTQVVFYGDPAKLSIMHKEFTEALEINDGDPGWLGRWLMYKNAEEELIRQVHTRGFVEDILFDNGVLTVYSNDAWEPCHIVYALMASYYGIDYELFADEPGNDLFFTTDIEHRFFPKECRVSVNVDSDLLECMPLMRFLNECSYIIEQDELIKAFNTEFPMMNIISLDNLIYLLTVECKLLNLDPELSFRIRPLDYVPKLFKFVSPGL